MRLSTARATATLVGVLCALSASAQMRCGAAARSNDGWAVATAPTRALDVEAVCRDLPQWAPPEANVHGVVVERGGELQLEAYFDGRDNPGFALFSREASFSADDLHDMRSVTKSIVALLFGVALERGLVPGLDTPVLDFFPEHADLRLPERSPERSSITLAHLLTMTHGLDWDESGSPFRLGNSATRMRFSADPDRHVLEHEMVTPPGSRFVYSSGATQLLGEVLVRRTGMPLEAFAEQMLFQPLGIQRSEWRRDRKDRVTPYGGLRLRPRDAAKIGRLVLDQGRWQGRQLVPAAWVEQMLRDRVTAGASFRYGYQWWKGDITTRAGRFAWAAGFGTGGQRLYLVPALDLVVVVTAGQYNQPATSWQAPSRVFRHMIEAVATK